ncbi:MAG: carbohydrate-binding family 9-like protein [Byssovorax sp.]
MSLSARRAAGLSIGATLALSLMIGCRAGPSSSSATADPDKSSAPASPAPPADVRAIKELKATPLPPDASIQIDGRLDEPIWQKAAFTGPFVEVGSGRENPRLPTQGSVRLLHDARALYLGFEVKDAHVHGGWPTDKKDPHLWEKDTVEVMIDPDGDGDNKDYYEIQVNPQNLVFDTQYDDYNVPNGNGRGPFGHEEWSAGLTSAVVVHGTLDDDKDTDAGYTVEVMIPWSSFTKAKASPPPPGSSWRMNFYAMKNNGGVAWSPILGQGNFHRASRFGRIRF